MLLEQLCQRLQKATVEEQKPTLDIKKTWWNDGVNNRVKKRYKLWKKWKQGNTRKSI